MDSHKIAATSLQCPVCKRRVQIWRKASKLRKIGHIKHMWCPYCRKKVGFVEVNNDLGNDSWLSLDGEINALCR